MSGGVTRLGSGLNGSGGGIFNNEKLILSNSYITDNLADGCGGGIANGGILDIISSTVANNVSRGTGGGICGGQGSLGRQNEKLTVIDSLVQDNTDTAENSGFGFGGGIDFAGSEFILIGSTVTGNKTTGGGGGIGISSGNFRIINSTITNNISGQFGGGLNFGFFRTTGIVDSVTVTGNIAESGGGGVVQGTRQPVLIQNSIIAENTVNSGAENGDDVFELFSPFTSGGFNLIIDGTGSTGFTAPGDQVGTSTNPIDPLLSPLQNNGGATPTQKLVPGSPALDAANPFNFPATDQRGVIRPQGNAPDIGAFELETAISVLEPSTLVGLLVITIVGTRFLPKQKQ